MNRIDQLFQEKKNNIIIGLFYRRIPAIKRYREGDAGAGEAGSGYAGNRRTLQ